MIEINITAVIQLVNFLVTLVVLNYLLIRPVRNILRQRREKTEGLNREIESFVQEAKTHLNEYEAALAKARDEANTNRKAAKDEAEVAEKAILAQAAKEAQATLQGRQAALREESGNAYAALKAQIPAYAEAAVGRLIG